MFAIRPFGITTLFKECIVLWQLHNTGFFMVLQFHILCGIVIFFWIVFGSISKRRNWTNGDSFNSLRRGWVCCVIDAIFYLLFYFIINNKTRRLIDFVNWIKELRHKFWKKIWQITWTTLDPPLHTVPSIRPKQWLNGEPCWFTFSASVQLNWL